VCANIGASKKGKFFHPHLESKNHPPDIFAKGVGQKYMGTPSKGPFGNKAPAFKRGIKYESHLKRRL